MTFYIVFALPDCFSLPNLLGDVSCCCGLSDNQTEAVARSICGRAQSGARKQTNIEQGTFNKRRGRGLGARCVRFEWFNLSASLIESDPIRSDSIRSDSILCADKARDNFAKCCARSVALPLSPCDLRARPSIQIAWRLLSRPRAYRSKGQRATKIRSRRSPGTAPSMRSNPFSSFISSHTSSPPSWGLRLFLSLARLAPPHGRQANNKHHRGTTRGKAAAAARQCPSRPIVCSVLGLHTGSDARLAARREAATKRPA